MTLSPSTIASFATHDNDPLSACQASVGLITRAVIRLHMCGLTTTALLPDASVEQRGITYSKLAHCLRRVSNNLRGYRGTDASDRRLLDFRGYQALSVLGWLHAALTSFSRLSVSSPRSICGIWTAIEGHLCPPSELHPAGHAFSFQRPTHAAKLRLRTRGLRGGGGALVNAMSFAFPPPC